MQTVLLLTSLALTGALSAQSTQRVSLDQLGAERVGSSRQSDISYDGRHVVFESFADLDPSLANGHLDVFVRDRLRRTTTVIDVGLGHVPSSGVSRSAAISGDGRFVTFFSEAGNLTSPGGRGIYLHDRDPDENGVFDEGNGTLQLVSKNSSQQAAFPPGDGPAISGDGRWISFFSYATDIVANDNNGSSDVFLWDRLTDSIRRISLGSGGIETNGDSYGSKLSHDGRFVTFESRATNLYPGAASTIDIFRIDRDPDQNGIFDEGNEVTILISKSSAGIPANLGSAMGDISADGSVVAFTSGATNLVPGFIFSDSRVFVHEVELGRTSHQSIATNNDPTNRHCFALAMSPDGRYLAFHSEATNLVGPDLNGVTDVYLRDRVGGTTSFLSLDNASAQSDGASFYPALSACALEASFESLALNLDPPDNNNSSDIFVRSQGVLPTEPWLYVPALGGGQSARFEVYGAAANEPVGFAFSLAGAGVGPCPGKLGGLCLDLLSPVELLGTTRADVTGHAVFELTLPNVGQVVPVALQAAIRRGAGGSQSVKSQVVATEVRP